MSVLSEKSLLRQQALAFRDGMARGRKDDAIRRALLTSDAFRQSDLLLCYVSVGSEVDTRMLLRYCFQIGKRVAVPLCERNGKMHFHEITSLSSLSPSPFGIPEPHRAVPVPQHTKKTLCVVPGMLFDESGYRIGYGGGYYDRFLPQFCGVSVGLCYEALMRESLPHDAHDCRVMQIITETEIRVLSQKEQSHG